MKIIVDMDGVLIPKSEMIFSEILKNKCDIDIKEYINETLINGRKITEYLSKEQNNILFRSYFHTIKNVPTPDVNANSKIIKLLKTRKDVEFHLISGSPEYIGEHFVSTFSLKEYFSKITFNARKLGDETFYLDYIKSLRNNTIKSLETDTEEPIVIVEDSLFQVINTAKLTSNDHTIKILFLFNPIYCFNEDVNEEVIKKVMKYDNVIMIFNFSEIVSELFPLVFDLRKYLPYPLDSAPTHDDLALSDALYREIYQNKNYFHFDVLDSDSFRWVEKRKYFVVFSLLIKDRNYNYNEILMKMDFGNGHVRWLLPGGSIRPELKEDYINLLFKKIHGYLLNREGIKIRNLYPVCNLTNLFINQDNQVRKIHTHHGIGWLGFITSSGDLFNELIEDIGNFENKFVPLSKIDPKNILQEPNKNVFIETRSSNRDFRFEHEGELNHLGMFIHRVFVKPFFSLFKEHKKFIKEKIKKTKPFSLIDISCGDDKDIIYYINNSNVKVVVMNDISPECILEMKGHINKNKQKCPKTIFLFSMQDATNLVNYREKIFDFAICKNTLHHFPSVKEKENCLEQLKKISRKYILVMDIEYPRVEAESSPIGKRFILLRHWYYMNILGESGIKDVDTAFLSYDDFNELIERNFPEKKYDKKFNRIKLPRGTYMVAFIERKNN